MGDLGARRGQRYPLGVGLKAATTFSGRSERALRGEPTVTVECLSCRHVGVLTGAALSRLAIMPDTPMATFVKRLRCSKCGGRSVLATRKPSPAAAGVVNVRRFVPSSGCRARPRPIWPFFNLTESGD
jgi:hypothetical protein